MRVFIFLAVSAAFVRLSWRPLRQVRSHGFYRFFAFEAISALILLNAPAWFRDPLSPRQLVSYLLGAASLVLAIEAFRLLLTAGKPSKLKAAPANLGFENTTALVTTGAYRFIRHPMYASLLALAWCAYLKNPLRTSRMLLVMSATGFLIATAVVEERENLARFGPDYSAYMKRTRRFVPFVF